MPPGTSPQSIENIKSRTQKREDFTMNQICLSSSTKITPVDSASPAIEAGTCERLDPYGLPLQPTPTNDPLDPLNFDRYTKFCCLLVVFVYSLLIIYSTTVYIPVTLALQTQFNTSYKDIAWSTATPSLGLSMSPLLSKPFADSYGRRIVLIVSISIAIIASGCASIQSINLSGYMAARFFQGLGTGPGLNVGLAILDDISWSHERGFRIGLWVMGTTIGAPLGLLIGGFLGEANQFWSSYHLVILYSVLLALIIITLPETLYPRHLIVAEIPMALTESHITPSNGLATMKRTRDIPLWNITRVPGINPEPLWTTALRYLQVWTYPNVAFGFSSLVFIQYWWCNSVMIMAPSAYANFSTSVQGALFIGFMLGSIVGEVFMSGRLGDWIVGTMARKSKNKNPALRLWLAYPAALTAGIGYALWGVSIDKGWHWMTGEVALFLFGAGVQIGNTTMSSYVVDLYPEHVMDVITFYSVLFNLASFVEPWFISSWVESSGYFWCFITQGLITFFGMVPAIILLQVYGVKWARPMVLCGDR